MEMIIVVYNLIIKYNNNKKIKGKMQIQTKRQKEINI